MKEIVIVEWLTAQIDEDERQVPTEHFDIPDYPEGTETR